MACGAGRKAVANCSKLTERLYENGYLHGSKPKCMADCHGSPKLQMTPKGTLQRTSSQLTIAPNIDTKQNPTVTMVFARASRNGQQGGRKAVANCFTLAKSQFENPNQHANRFLNRMETKIYY